MWLVRIQSGVRVQVERVGTSVRLVTGSQPVRIGSPSQCQRSTDGPCSRLVSGRLSVRIRPLAPWATRRCAAMPCKERRLGFDTEVVHHARVAQLVEARRSDRRRWRFDSSPGHVPTPCWRSSVVRAPGRQPGGRGFDPLRRREVQVNVKPIPQERYGQPRQRGHHPQRCTSNHLHQRGGFAVGKARRLLTGRGARRRGFDSLTLRTSHRSLLGRSASLITTRQVVRLHPTGLMPL